MNSPSCTTRVTATDRDTRGHSLDMAVTLPKEQGELMAKGCLSATEIEEHLRVVVPFTMRIQFAI